MIDSLLQELSRISQVEAIALGGSRAGEHYDAASDYDIYLYCTGNIDENTRKRILEKYCSRIETGNSFWEYEDNCTLKNGVDIDILYRNLDSFTDDVAAVAERFVARNGYTTCMWHNLLTCKIVYDASGCLAAAKKRFTLPYPEQLKKNIIERNFRLLHTAMPAYDGQIKKALKRGDLVAVNHRTAAFMESYFDIIFALNSLTHPGEKRLVQLCEKNCGVLPVHFRENIEKLYSHLFTDNKAAADDIDEIVTELQKILNRAD